MHMPTMLMITLTALLPGLVDAIYPANFEGPKFRTKRILYVIQENAPQWLQLYVVDHIDKINEQLNGTIRLAPKLHETPKFYLNYTEAECLPVIGSREGGTTIKLGARCIKTSATHETLHALGLRHIHSRWNRDNYLFINETNIEKDGVGAFAKCVTFENSTHPLFATYNPNSSLLYSEWAWPKDPLYRTIVPLNSSSTGKIGYEKYVTKYDAQGI